MQWIVDGFVILTVETGLSLDSFDPSLLIVDVTGVDPRPEPGWLYQPDRTPNFIAPKPVITPEPPSLTTPEPPLKTRYTHREFILRLGPEYAKIERVRDENNAKPPSKKNYDLARLFRLYDEAEWIGLDDPSLAEAMQAFVGLGLMSEERAAEILTPNEPPQPGDPV